jgi:hypothetical protein
MYHVPEMYLLPELLARARMRSPYRQAGRPAREVAYAARRESARQLSGR